MGRRVEPVLLCALVASLALLAPAIWSALTDVHSPLAELSHHTGFLFRDMAAGRGVEGLSWFLLAWCASLIVAGHWARERGPGDARAASRDVLDAALLSALAFYSLSFFHPQYTALLALLVLARLHRLKDCGPAHGLQLLGVLFLLLGFLDGNATTQLFLPLAPASVAQLPSPQQSLPLVLSTLPWPALGRSLLVLAALWMSFDLLRTRRERGEHQRPAPLRPTLYLVCVCAWPLAALSYYAGARAVTHYEQVGPEQELEVAWSPGATSEPMRLRPRIQGLEQADHVEIRPGRGGGRVAAGEAELVLGRFAARPGEEDQLVRERIPLSELSMASGSLRLPLYGLEPQGWRWHEIHIESTQRVQPAQPTRVRFLRETTKDEVFARARVELGERTAGFGWWLALPGLALLISVAAAARWWCVRTRTKPQSS